MNFLNLVKTRKSIRSFSDKKVDKKTIEKILEFGTYAPTTCNQQLWNFIVIEDSKVKDRLINHAASNTLIKKAPVIIIVTYDGWNYKEAIQNSSLAVENILLGANYCGLGALAMNSYGSDSKIKRILDIPNSETICCFIALGYPDSRAKKASLIPRRNISEVIHWSKFHKRTKPPFVYNPNVWTLKNLKDHQDYYCRKTFLGKQMDLYSPFEKKLIHKILSNSKGTFSDLMTYDGCYLSEFPNEKIFTFDLSEEVMQYTKESLKINNVEGNFIHKIYNPLDLNLLKNQNISNITLLYKAERLSNRLLNRVVEQSYSTLDMDGKIIIISRRKSFLFNLFYKTIKLLFGNDVRKTGIYTFFGPYKPIESKKLKRILKKQGFRYIKERKYFLIPPFFDQALQMYLQYKKSSGSSYLHRVRIENFLTKFLSFILKSQGIRRSRFGSISVLEAIK
jgi:nitroreductase